MAFHAGFSFRFQSVAVTGRLMFLTANQVDKAAPRTGGAAFLYPAVSPYTGRKHTPPPAQSSFFDFMLDQRIRIVTIKTRATWQSALPTFTRHRDGTGVAARSAADTE
jgi:hypothetical protein